MISAVEALKEAYTPGNRAIKFFARLRKIDVIELACKIPGAPIPLSDIVEAHRYMESNEQIGKIVVTV